MAQYLKEEVQQAIAQSALEVFSRRGFGAATMAEIAQGAGVSTGNIYRYYGSKEVLFYDVVSPEFTRRLLGLLRARIESLRGVDDVGALGPEAHFHSISEELLRFGIENRLRIVVLLGHAEGTRYAGFAGELQEWLCELAISHVRRLDPTLEVRPTTRFVLERIYRSWSATLVDILSTFTAEGEIRDAVADYSRYHLAGLNHLLR